MDPQPWSDGDLGELERRLLEAAKRDRVPDALGARMAQGLGVHVAGTTTAGASAAGGLGAPLFAKVGLWGVLSLALVAAVAGWRGAQSGAPSTRAAHAAREDAPPAAALPRSDRTTSAIDETAQPTAVAQSSAQPPPERPAAAFDDAALRAEIALLDRVRDALQRGASTRALRLLDRHHQRFAPAKLAPEAAALRIEALVQHGSHAQAITMSRHFTSTYPTHPLRDHVSSLTTPR